MVPIGMKWPLIPMGDSSLTRANQPNSPGEWAKIREIHATILEAPTEQWPRLIEELCGGDTPMRHEIEGLLAAHLKADGFLDQGLTDALAPAQDAKLADGTILDSRFHIIRHIDTGGMGAVYEAWDMELGEMVALKTIRPDIASHRSVIDRFKEEVRQAHQITHPNVSRVNDLFSHDTGTGQRIWFLTMQLLHGETLSERLKRKGPMAAPKALILIKQLISGLNAAHQHGIVHRDFKSSNIMLVEETEKEVRAVINDFGLAIHVTQADSTEVQLVRQGTMAYVAPEQWYDGIVSPAGDQYSLGVVMCEVLTCERPAHVSREDGVRSAAKLPAGKKLNPRWEAVIRRCLATDPEDRFKCLDDILTWVDPSHRRLQVARWASIAVVALIAIAIVVFVAFGVRQELSISDLQQITPAADFSVSPRLSADGGMITYVSDRAESGNEDVWVQQLPTGTPRKVTNNAAHNENPSISPDGRTVVFESSLPRPGIYVTELDGAGPRLVVAGGHEPMFSPIDRSIVFWTGDEYSSRSWGKVYRYELNSGKQTQLAASITDASSPIWNSDGKHVLFTGCQEKANTSPCDEDWWVTDTDQGTPRPTGATAQMNAQQLRPSGSFAGWRGDTVIFSALHGSFMGLWSIKIDPRTGKVDGAAKELKAGDTRDFIISSALENDSLAFCQMNPAMHIWRIDNVSNPQHAKAYKITQDPRFDRGPSVSRNGKVILFARGYSDDRDLYLHEIATGGERLIEAPGHGKISPLPNESGSALAYEALDHGTRAVFVSDLDGKSHKVCSDCRNPTGWIRGPESLLVGNLGKSEVQIVPLSGGQSRTILSVPNVLVRDAVWSAANQYIVFTISKRDAPGQQSIPGKVYAAHFSPGADRPDSRWIEITEDSTYSRRPVWSTDGGTIFYLSERDGFWCIWGQRFDPVKGTISQAPFPVYHFHDMKLSPSEISGDTFNLTSADDSLYLNLVQTGGTIWLGKLSKKLIFGRSR